MLNKKVAVSFILSLVLIFSLSSVASAVEMGMDKDKALKEILKMKLPKSARVMDWPDDNDNPINGNIEIQYMYKFIDGRDKETNHHLDKYHYFNNKIDHIVKYYNSDYHDQLLPSMIKVYGKPAADYYGKKDGSDEYSIQKINSMSKKDSDKLIRKKDLERRTLWENKKEYIVLLSYGNGTYVLRFWRDGIYKEWPVGGGNDFRDFIEN